MDAFAIRALCFSSTAHGFLSEKQDLFAFANDAFDIAQLGSGSPKGRVERRRELLEWQLGTDQFRF